MKTMKKLVCLLLVFALLLSFGCKKDEQPETPDESVNDRVPAETPPVEQPPVEETKPEPVINTRPDTTPDKMIPEKEADTLDLDARRAAFNSYREVGYFMEWQLGDGYTILETIPGDQDGEYLLWGMRIIEPGFREPFQMQVKVTPDGKDFSLLSKKELEVTEEWKAVQNYRALVHDLAGGIDLLNALGYDVHNPTWKQGEPISTDIDYDHFQAAMLSIMTQEMYDAHWADYFIEQDGKLAMVDISGSSDLYLVEMVQPQEDGSYISYEFMHHYNQDLFYTYFVKVDLEEQPNGTFRVNGWDADNTALIDQAYTAVPID